MFGFKKKPINSISLMHYEGLAGFKQDFPCTITLEDDFMVFQNHEGNVAKLPYDRILKVDAMPEVNFMAKYHNNKAKTKKGTVWFRIITYTTSAGEEAYVAVWDVSMKTMKFFDQLEARIKTAPTETIL